MCGDYLELKLLDEEWRPQGIALVRVIQTRVVAVSDGYLQWWLDSTRAKLRSRGSSPSTFVPREPTRVGDQGAPAGQFPPKHPFEGTWGCSAACLARSAPRKEGQKKPHKKEASGGDPATRGHRPRPRLIRLHLREGSSEEGESLEQAGWGGGTFRESRVSSRSTSTRVVKLPEPAMQFGSSDHQKGLAFFE